jgi:hypothetical protein
VWLSNRRALTVRPRAGQSGSQVSIGASMESWPRSASIMIATAVNCLVREAMRKTASGVSGTAHSILAIP